MAADMSFQKLSHEAVHSSACGAHEVQNIGAIPLLVERAHESLHLALNASCSEDKIGLVLNCVTQEVLLPDSCKLPYPLWYHSKPVELAVRHDTHHCHHCAYAGWQQRSEP